MMGDLTVRTVFRTPPDREMCQVNELSWVDSILYGGGAHCRRPVRVGAR